MHPVAVRRYLSFLNRFHPPHIPYSHIHTTTSLCPFSGGDEEFNPLNETLGTGVVKDADTVLAALNGDVGARLTLNHKAALERRKADARRRETERNERAVPVIDVHSKMLRREGEVSQRLYNERLKQEELRERATRKKEVDSEVDGKTGRRLFRPLINKKSEALTMKSRFNDAVEQTQRRIEKGEDVDMSSDGTSVLVSYKIEDSLISRGKVYDVRKERNLKRVERKVEEMGSTVKISKASEEITRRMGVAGKRSGLVGLTKPIANIKQSTVDELKRAEPSFQPTLESSKVERQRHGYYDTDGTSSRGSGVARRNKEWVAKKEAAGWDWRSNERQPVVSGWPRYVVK